MIRFLKRILGSEKWLVGFMVIVLYISAILLVIIGSIKLFLNCWVVYQQIVNSVNLDIGLIASNFLSIMDIYLLALVFYMFAIGIYKLFIGEHELFLWLNIKTIEDLKKKTASMIVLFLATLFVEQAAIGTSGIQLLYSGISISALCAMLILYSYLHK